jgi:hypothetical protein
MLSFSTFECNADLSLRWEVRRDDRAGMELCANGLRDALLDEAQQFGFDVVAGELE